MAKYWVLKLYYKDEEIDTLIVTANTEAEAALLATTQLPLPQLRVEPLEDMTLLTDALPDNLRDGLVKKLLSET